MSCIIACFCMFLCIVMCRCVLVCDDVFLRVFATVFV